MIDPTRFGMLAPKHYRYAYGIAGLVYFGLRLAMAIIEDQGIMVMPPYAAETAMAAAIFCGALVGIRIFMRRDVNDDEDDPYR